MKYFPLEKHENLWPITCDRNNNCRLSNVNCVLLENDFASIAL